VIALRVALAGRPGLAHDPDENTREKEKRKEKKRKVVRYYE
jgi:hypothetical protein